MLTIIMYHYVRDLPNTRYPRIKGLLTSDFEGQLDYLNRYYTVCNLQQLTEAVNGYAELPPNACLLTFDDGFKDHYETVMPRLVARNLQGSFFVTALPLLEHRVLDVHKIHFILASTLNQEILVHEILGIVRAFRSNYEIADDDTLYHTLAISNRYDPPEVCFVKRALQYGLPEPVRVEVVHTLFERHVTRDEATFSQELYLNLEDLQIMAQAGMDIGGHGYSHQHLGKMPANKQSQEIERTLDFLTAIYKKPVSSWAMCYPNGSYNEDTLLLLQNVGCTLGLTTQVGIVHDLSKPLELNRLDTNDLPFDGNAEIVPWTARILGN
jgi:peptidoglycan/xylan/chitin deacetylase (PgdA/CDA1 family)